MHLRPKSGFFFHGILLQHSKTSRSHRKAALSLPITVSRWFTSIIDNCTNIKNDKVHVSYTKISVQPVSMEYQCISIELHPMGDAGTVREMQGVAAWSQLTAGQLTGDQAQPGVHQLGVPNQHAADGIWWPGDHTLAPKAPSTYAAESRSKLSQRLGLVGKTNKLSLGRRSTGGRRQMDEEKSRGERKAGIALTLRKMPH